MKKTIMLLLTLIIMIILVTPAIAANDNAPAPKPGVGINGGDMTWNKIDEATVKANFTQSVPKATTLPAKATPPEASV